ncbi:MAG: D-alanyl-D-alanine carboxypeptidase family protein, partial [Bacteroidales bacterium]|nr:D-alanyl-D-alanine carboxypeptidase family protein [Bacteroidales bacterium]
MKKLLVSVVLLFIICVAASVVSANMTSGVFESTASCVAAAPTKDFLLGKTHYEKDTNFVEIPPAYTVLRKPNNFIQKRTLEAFLKMHAAAKDDGVKLVATSASRNFWVQRYIWEQKWQKITDHQGAARAKYILQYNSMCGTSRHHWGTELDLNSPKLEYWNSVE